MIGLVEVVVTRNHMQVVSVRNVLRGVIIKMAGVLEVEVRLDLVVGHVTVAVRTVSVAVGLD